MPVSAERLILTALPIAKKLTPFASPVFAVVAALRAARLRVKEKDYKSAAAEIATGFSEAAIRMAPTPASALLGIAFREAMSELAERHGLKVESPPLVTRYENRGALIKKFYIPRRLRRQQKLFKNCLIK